MSWKICLSPTVGANIPSSGKNGYLVRHNTTMAIPCHPQYIDRGVWVNGSPMSRYVIEVEPFGQFEIPSGSILAGYIQTIGNEPVMQIRFETIFDVSTGDCRLTCQIKTDANDNYRTFCIKSSNCAIDVPVHQTMQDAMSFRQSQRELVYGQIEAVTGFIGSGINFGTNYMAEGTATHKSIAASGAKSGLIEHAVNTDRNLKKVVDSATQANQVSVSGSASNGSYISFTRDLITPKVYCYFQELVEEYNVEKGRPLCRTKQLNTLSGFMVCNHADIATTGTQEENEAINAFLNGGFYYE